MKRRRKYRVIHPAAVACLQLAALLAGCSTAAWYESARVSAELECQKQPAGAYEECMSRVNQKSYKDYRREREAVKPAP